MKKLFFVILGLVFIFNACGNMSEEREREEKAEQAALAKAEEAEQEKERKAKEEEKKKEAEQEKERKAKEEKYAKLVSVTHNYSDSCTDYEYNTGTEWLSFDLQEDKDAQGAEWSDQTIQVTTKEGEKLYNVYEDGGDISLKFVDSEEYTVKVMYEQKDGKEYAKTLTVKKDDIVQGEKFDPATECEKEEPTPVPDVDVDVPEVDVDTPDACGAGEHWVRPHMRGDKQISGHCRKN